MKIQVFWSLIGLICLSIRFLTETCRASVLNVGLIRPGFQGAQINFVDINGLFLLSNNSNFSFGFSATTDDETSLLLVVVHKGSSRTVWTANRGSPVKNTDKFVFEDNGNMYLEKGGSKIWSTDTAGQEVTSLELLDSGNLILFGKNRNRPIWQSFSHPTDTLLSDQSFSRGMKLYSNPRFDNLSSFLEFHSGDLILYAGFRIPQPYWSMGRERRKVINEFGGDVYSAILSSNSWNLYDQNQTLIWQFIFSDNSDHNVTWAAVLGGDGSISFFNLQVGRSSSAEMEKIPEGSCNTPESCDAYFVCSGDYPCSCPPALSSHQNCKPEIITSCTASKTSMNLLSMGNKFDYPALEFFSPLSIADLEGCKEACLRNCSCRVLFFKNNTKNCFLFDEIGSLRRSGENSSTELVSYFKISRGSSSSNQKHFPFVVIIIVAIVLAGASIFLLGFIYYRRKKRLPAPPQGSPEEGEYTLENLSSMPIRLRYQVLETATNNFSMKLGQGGFGSVYKGVLLDGTQIAVKKLEGIGQGKKEFQAEVSVLGTIYHSHLVQIKGFCAEGNHRLLAYEYMAKGSLDKWIFAKNKQDFSLNWETRFDIALGTAKGLAYLHEDCYVRIVHCDIKPGNVLLDDKYQAKLSDFGMAKLMTREQSRVFTTLRGTRGYLAPEWIMNHPISEKSDVYSYGILLLEIIGGRKILDPSENSEKAYFPLYAYKMLKEGKIREILDPILDVNTEDERALTAIKVALLCIQEDMHARPSMSKVVQMLEGVLDVPQLPSSTREGCHIYSIYFKSKNNESTFTGNLPDNESNALLSAVQLSGPR